MLERRSRLSASVFLSVILCGLVSESPAQQPFLRGDSNADGQVDLSDGIATLRFLFSGGERPGCEDAADTNDSGNLDLSDAVAVFAYLFTGGAPPPAPGPSTCGLDPTADGLGCLRFGPCAPVISGVRVAEIRTTSAAVLWDTDRPADSRVEYGVTTSYGSSVFDPTLVRRHEILLERLRAGTTYHFRVGSAGSVSPDATFTTPRDTRPPAILDVVASEILATSALIAWRTDELADSRVEYGLNRDFDLAASDGVLKLMHAVLLDGLSPGTRYRFRVRSTDEAGNTATGPELTLSTPSRPAVENLTANEELRHNLALLVGSTASAATSITVTRGAESRVWPVEGGRFKALVPLQAGANEVRLEAAGEVTTVPLRYTPQRNPRFLRLVYLVAADGDGTFDAPPGEPNNAASAVERIRLAAWMLQAFTAEKLHAQGLGRRSFHLLTGADGLPIVEALRSSLTMAEAHSMDGLDLWFHIWQELAGLPEREDSKDLVILQMTRYDPLTRTARAHTALGGDRLALFGSGNLHTWARSLDEVVARFADTRRLDVTRLFDDSNGRGTYWANYATGIGACLHEVGHTLSLPHTANGKGIMARQFDHVNRTFVVSEPPSNTTSGLALIAPEDEPGWHRSNAVRLRYHRWLALDDVPLNDEAVTFTVSEAEVRVESPAGIRHLAYHVAGDVVTHDEHLASPPRSLRLIAEDLRQRHSTAPELHFNAIDDDGNIAEAVVPLSPPSILDLHCERAGADALLSWTNAASADAVRIYRDGMTVTTLPGSATTARVRLRSAVVSRFRVAPVVAGSERAGAACSVLVEPSEWIAAIDEDFSAPLRTDEVLLNCSAARRNARLELTPPSPGQAGSAFFLDRIADADFVASFDLSFDEPSQPGADGIAFIITPSQDLRACGDAGSGLGYFSGLGREPRFEGYAVLFDTSQGQGEPSHNWIGFASSRHGSAPQVAVDLPEELTGNGPFRATVVGERGTFTLLLGNAAIGMAEREVFSHTVEGYTPRNVAFGFSASTGGAWARHSVDNITLLAPPQPE